ncbi:unnamed protein product [Rotaria sordida]|uniref:Uncharacterized protein n=1 Tax=Rotaria sordida TaxID=392033 RepID=A0A815RIW7_9BILA|nr:unnamed protein product [Rotaria sordida]CAF4149344.1 unnamed protein product [Rotaria sordida]
MTTAVLSSNLNDVWMKVSEGIELIYRIQKMLPETYMKLYGLIYDYCTNTSSQGLTKRVPRRPSGNNRNKNLHDGKKCC